MSATYQIKRYLTYWLDAQNEHSLHAPFIYDLYTEAIKPTKAFLWEAPIQDYRKRLIASRDTLEVKDLGAGSRKHNKQKLRKVSEIARGGVSKQKYSRILRRLSEFNRSKYVLELGTSLGLNTMYLATDSRARVITVEGADALGHFAQSAFDNNGLDNIKVVTADISENLENILQDMPALDFAFLDANHTYEATLKYFQLCLNKSGTHTIIVLDDIYLNEAMHNAWRDIVKRKVVTLSIDLFQLGIVICNPTLIKQHYVLQT